MENKTVGVLVAVLQGVGIILLLAAAFDVTKISDNMLIFVALSIFIISGIVRRVASAGSCCKH